MSLFLNVSYSKICSFLFTVKYMYYPNHKVKFMILGHFSVQIYHTYKYLWYLCTDQYGKR